MAANGNIYGYQSRELYDNWLCQDQLETEMDKHVFLAVFELSGYARKIVNTKNCVHSPKRKKVEDKKKKAKCQAWGQSSGRKKPSSMERVSVKVKLYQQLPSYSKIQNN